MKYTEKMKADGEMAVRGLSDKAAEYYYGTDPFTVFAYENEDGETRYSYSHEANPYADRRKRENLTFEELQEDLEEMQEENYKLLAEDGELEDYLKSDLHKNPRSSGLGSIGERESAQKISNTMEQLTEREKELLLSFYPLKINTADFTVNPEVRTIKDKFNLSWSELRGIRGLVSALNHEREKGKNMINGNASTPQAEEKTAPDSAKYNISTRIDGKYAMLSLSGKASEYYLGTDPLTVFEYGNEEKRYAYSYAENPYMDKKIVSDLTFEELQEAFEKMQAEKEKNDNGGLDMDKKTEGNHESEYQLLNRLRTDCEYFLGAGNRATKNLWAGNVEGQIAKMRELYNILPEKPEWLTEQDIDRYEKLMTAEQVPKAQPADKKLTALLTIIQGGMTKYLDMGDVSMDDIFRQLKKSALPFVEIKGDVIYDEGRFAELEQSGRVSVSVTADIDNDRLTVYETNGVPEAERTKDNTRIWSREKMNNFLKDRVREPKTDNSQHSPFCGVGRSHVSEHEREM